MDGGWNRIFAGLETFLNCFFILGPRKFQALPKSLLSLRLDETDRSAPSGRSVDFFLPRKSILRFDFFGEKTRFQQFSKKSIPYASPSQTARTKMTAIGFSSYELFVKNFDFDAFLQYIVSLFMKTHFFISSLPR